MTYLRRGTSNDSKVFSIAEPAVNLRCGKKVWKRFLGRLPLSKSFLSVLGALFAVLVAQPAAADSGRAWKGLVFDARKIVSAQEDTGWKIDKYEIEDMMPDMLVSVCQTPPAARQKSRAVLLRRVGKLGGPLELAITTVDDHRELAALISAERALSLLTEAVRRAPGECPVWMKPDADFAGIQTDAYRFTINVEGGGLFVAQRAGQRNDVGAGGTGRLLLAYGLNYRRTVLWGLEFGGNALFQRGNDSVNFPLQFLGAVPLVLRHHLLTFHHDLEVAPLIYFTDADTRPSFGARAGVTLGLSLFRIRRIMPWAGVGFSLEYLFANQTRPTITAAKGGARFGFDWDF